MQNTIWNNTRCIILLSWSSLESSRAQHVGGRLQVFCSCNYSDGSEAHKDSDYTSNYALLQTDLVWQNHFLKLPANRQRQGFQKAEGWYFTFLQVTIKQRITVIYHLQLSALKSINFPESKSRFICLLRKVIELRNFFQTTEVAKILLRFTWKDYT